MASNARARGEGGVRSRARVGRQGVDERFPQAAFGGDAAGERQEDFPRLPRGGRAAAGPVAAVHLRGEGGAPQPAFGVAERLADGEVARLTGLVDESPAVLDRPTPTAPLNG
ncbi:MULTISPECIES: hypothetical protein [unclassified Streptomyces]|uniref:hypothetical protein n=1 Tax=unclassified Streptomyces TaxID=2593676 RepID=UPI001927125A|nr:MULTISPECIES: hypothetical protein [unclassified Streptomyces]